jgi:recombination associated protein RdgC
MFFKNAMIFNLTRPIDFTDGLEIALSGQVYVPCGANDLSKLGFVPPLPGTQALTLVIGNDVLLAMTKEEKIIPRQAMCIETAKRVDSIETSTGRKIKKKEKQQIADDVLSMMCTKAFSKYKTTYVWIDNENQRIVIDTASVARADEILSALRRAIGSLPVVPLKPDNPLEMTMSEWVKNGTVIGDQPFELTDKLTLRSAIEHGGTVTAKDQDLAADEIISFVSESDKIVTTIGMKYETAATFTLTSDCLVKQIKFNSETIGQNDDCNTMKEKYDADFVLMADILRRLIDDLCVTIGSEKAGDL